MEAPMSPAVRNQKAQNANDATDKEVFFFFFFFFLLSFWFVGWLVSWFIDN